MRRMALCLFIIIGISASLTSKYEAVSAEPSPYRIPDKKGYAKEESKLGSRIRETLKRIKAMGITRENMKDFNPQELSTPLVRLDESGNIQTYIYLREVNEENLTRLESLGVRIEVANEKYGIVQGWIPFDKLGEVEDLGFVRKVTPPIYGETRTGSVSTEGDAIIGSDEVRSKLGFDGSGVLVGVISDGIDSMVVSQATGDLPDNIITVNTGRGDEGTALLEVIHDIAPGARLAFSSGLTTARFIDAVQFLTEIGADVIVDDLGFLGEPFFEDGVVAQEAGDAVSKGVVFVSAAGNDADQHYQALYRDTSPGDDSNNLHDFGLASGRGSDVAMRVRIPPKETVVFTLQWDDPFGGSSNDYDLFLFDPSTGDEIDSSTEVQDGNDDPVETAATTNPSSSAFAEVDIVINRFKGRAKTLEMFFNGSVIPDEFNVPEDSVFGHPAVPGVIAVGAVPSNTPNSIEPFSSQGPVSISFPPESRPKPDVVAPDRISTTLPGFNPFAGTSAAAPHVAGTIALMLDKNPSLTPEEVAAILGDTATDLGQPGFDNVFGFGRVDALDAVESVTEGTGGGQDGGEGGSSGCSLASSNTDGGILINLSAILIPTLALGIRRLSKRGWLKSMKPGRG